MLNMSTTTVIVKVLVEGYHEHSFTVSVCEKFVVKKKKERYSCGGPALKVTDNGHEHVVFLPDKIKVIALI